MSEFPNATSQDAPRAHLCLSPRQWRRKRKADWVVKCGYWKGFQAGISDSLRPGMEYTSTSGLYDLNPAGEVAEDAGYEEGMRVRKMKRESFSLPWRYEVPGSVFRKAYDAVGIR